MMETVFSGGAIVLKFGLYLSVFSVAGPAILMLAWFDALQSLRSSIRRRMQAWALVCAMFALLIAIWQTLSLMMLSGASQDDVMVYLTFSGASNALLHQIAGCAALLVGASLRGISGVVLAYIGAAVLLGSFTYVGHIGTGLINLALFIHLAFGAAWFGILTPLQRLAADPSQIANTAQLGHIFGRAAQVFVPVSMILGGVLAWSIVGSVTALLTTSYGWVLIAKVLCSAGLLALAAANKLRFVPAMAQGDALAATKLVQAIQIERILFAVIFALTAILTTSLATP